MDDRPSSLGRRLASAAFVCFGLVAAVQLGGYQVGWWHAWEPLFGHGTAAVVRSAFSRALPVPDAWVGAAAYLVELVLELSGGAERWRDRPMLTAANMALLALMALGSAGLVAAQGLILHAWCTLCLVSAACSFVVAILGWPEMRAVGWRLARRHA